MRDIAANNHVANTSNLGMELRCASAVGMTLGSLLFGARIVPVTGKLASLPHVLPHPSYVLAWQLGLFPPFSSITPRGGVFYSTFNVHLPMPSALVQLFSCDVLPLSPSCVCKHVQAWPMQALSTYPSNIL